MRILKLMICLLGFQAVYAHNPDIASLMIYEQNGKSILLIKSSLTAFEGEVNYVFGKDAYKTPDEFNQLVVQHFQRSCTVLINGKTVTFSNIQIQLGHETNLFAELDNVPKTIKSFSVRNALFSDRHSNLCELILALNGFQQKQHILTKANNHEVNLKIEGDKWVVAEATTAPGVSPDLLVGLGILSIILVFCFVVSKQKLQLSEG